MQWSFWKFANLKNFANNCNVRKLQEIRNNAAKVAITLQKLEISLQKLQ